MQTRVPLTEGMRRPLLSSIAWIAGTFDLGSTLSALGTSLTLRFSFCVYCSGGRIAIFPRSGRRDSWRRQRHIICYMVRTGR